VFRAFTYFLISFRHKIHKYSLVNEHVDRKIHNTHFIIYIDNTKFEGRNSPNFIIDLIPKVQK